jgi:hypothetical protein
MGAERVRGLADDAPLLRLAPADQVADDDQPGRNADAGDEQRSQSAMSMAQPAERCAERNPYKEGAIDSSVGRR